PARDAGALAYAPDALPEGGGASSRQACAALAERRRAPGRRPGRGEAARRLAAPPSARLAVAGSDRRLPLAARGAARLAVRAESRHGEARLRETPRGRVAPRRLPAVKIGVRHEFPENSCQARFFSKLVPDTVFSENRVRHEFSGNSCLTPIFTGTFFQARFAGTSGVAGSRSSSLSSGAGGSSRGVPAFAVATSISGRIRSSGTGKMIVCEFRSLATSVSVCRKRSCK